MQIICLFNEVRVVCSVIEDLGYQGGTHVKTVEYKGRERIVVKRGNVWQPPKTIEKIMPHGKYQGQ